MSKIVGRKAGIQLLDRLLNSENAEFLAVATILAMNIAYFTSRGLIP